jgi:S-DNA-T family DNA segregation ATPase FtsK/SpoIIIE
MLSSFGQRWLFHLDDPSDAQGVGVRAGAAPPAIPGRILVVGSRLEAQVAILPIPAPATAVTGQPVGPGSPMTIGTLPEHVVAATLPATLGDAAGSTPLVLGLDFASLEPAAMDVPDGEHAIILGPARSGRSTALIRSIAAWRAAHPAGTVIVRCPRGTSPVRAWVSAHAPDALVAADDAAIVAAVCDTAGSERIACDVRVLVAIDDAERVDDATGALLGVVGARHANVMVVAAGRPDTLRTMYGHWTAVVRRSRIGVVMTNGGESDGELLGELLPKRTPVRPRAGLGWLFDNGGRRLVQVASDVP